MTRNKPSFLEKFTGVAGEHPTKESDAKTYLRLGYRLHKTAQARRYWCGLVDPLTQDQEQDRDVQTNWVVSGIVSTFLLPIHLITAPIVLSTCLYREFRNSKKD